MFSKINLTGQWEPRFKFAYTEFEGDKLFIFGGQTHAKTVDKAAFVVSCQVAEGGNISWSITQPPIVNPTEGPPRLRGASAVYYNSQIILFGGKNDFSHFNNVWILDTLNWEWQKVVNNQGMTVTSQRKIIDHNKKPAKRSSHSAVVCADKMIVFGGIAAVTVGSGVTNDCWIFNLKTHQWSELQSNSRFYPAERHSHSAVSCHDRYMVIFGGSRTTNKGSLLNDIWIYDVTNGQWTQVDHFMTPTSLQPSPMLNHQSIYLDNGIVLMSGGSTKSGLVKQYTAMDLQNLRFLPLDTSGAKDIPLKRKSHAFALLPKLNKIIILGGKSSRKKGKLADFWAVDLPSVTASLIPEINYVENMQAEIQTFRLRKFEQFLEVSGKLKPDDSLLLQRAVVHWTLGEVTKCLETLLQMTAQTLPDVKKLKALALVRLGRYKEAVTAAEGSSQPELKKLRELEKQLRGSIMRRSVSYAEAMDGGEGEDEYLFEYSMQQEAQPQVDTPLLNPTPLPDSKAFQIGAYAASPRCGSTTYLLQLRNIYTQSMNYMESATYRDLVRQEVNQSLVKVLQALFKLESQGSTNAAWSHENNQKVAQQVVEKGIASVEEVGQLLNDRKLLQRIQSAHRDLNLPLEHENVLYLFQKYFKIQEPNYLPSTGDILRIWKKSTFFPPEIVTGAVDPSDPKYGAYFKNLNAMEFIHKKVPFRITENPIGEPSNYQCVMIVISLQNFEPVPAIPAPSATTQSIDPVFTSISPEEGDALSIVAAAAATTSSFSSSFSATPSTNSTEWNELVSVEGVTVNKASDCSLIRGLQFFANHMNKKETKSIPVEVVCTHADVLLEKIKFDAKVLDTVFPGFVEQKLGTDDAERGLKKFIAFVKEVFKAVNQNKSRLVRPILVNTVEKKTVAESFKDVYNMVVATALSRQLRQQNLL